MKYPDILLDLHNSINDPKRVFVAALVGWEQDKTYIGVCSNWNGNVEVAGPNYSMPPFVYISDKMGNITPYHPTPEEANSDKWYMILLREREPVEEIEEEAVALEGQLNITPAEALQTLSTAFKADPDYAWSWHCNIAVTAFDEGLTHEASNKAAATFMMRAFGVDTSEMHKTKDISNERADELMASYTALQNVPSQIAENDDDYNADDVVARIDDITDKLNVPDSNLLPPEHDVE